MKYDTCIIFVFFLFDLQKETKSIKKKLQTTFKKTANYVNEQKKIKIIRNKC